ncbi:hypothetical protein [Coleofasciculus sp. E2-BRE-01]|uniref:hypothetical protein n=1 Tax=Coleofasciculus sp. E2-BRE-01 TaxID=3069524 RepID=UPI0032FE46BE
MLKAKEGQSEKCHTRSHTFGQVSYRRTTPLLNSALQLTQATTDEQAKLAFLTDIASQYAAANQPKLYKQVLKIYLYTIPKQWLWRLRQITDSIGCN